MKAVKSLLSSNPTFLVCSLCFLILLSVAIWDVHNLIKDYVEDNRITTIRRRNITDTFPFLDDMSICLHYQPENPRFTSSRAAFQALMPGRNVSWHRGSSDNVSGFSSYFLAYHIIGHIDTMETRAVDYMAAMLRVSRADLHELADTFLADPKSVEIAIEAWMQVKDMLIGHLTWPAAKDLFGHPQHWPDVSDQLRKGMNTMIYPFAEKKEPEFECFEIPNSENMRIDRTDMIYLLDQVRAGGAEAETADIFTDYPHGLNINGGPPGTLSLTLITIYNNGLYDVSRYPPCTREYRDEKECLKGVAAKAVSDVCSCTQFSKFLDEVLRKNQTGRPPKRFCTSKIYAECQQRAQEEANRRQEEAKNEGTCTPCVFAKNMFSISLLREVPQMYNMTPPWRSRTALHVRCKETTYMNFEEKPQTTPSQLGGELGLYIGFSMVSILQLILYLWRVARKKGRTSGCIRSVVEDAIVELEGKKAEDAERK